MADDPIRRIDPPPLIQDLARMIDGTIDDCVVLPDGSGVATMSMPLPKDHWLTAAGDNDPPMPWRMGTDDPERPDVIVQIRAAARYAIRASTANGKIIDFDPDAMERNFIVGLLGYFTPDGRSRV